MIPNVQSPSKPATNPPTGQAIVTQSPLLAAIEEIQSNGLASRCWAQAGLWLAICQRCPKWEGYGCRRVSVEPGAFAEFLCDGGRSCDRWWEVHR